MPTGDRDVARAHGRLQNVLATLREHVDETTEMSTNAVAEEAVAVLGRLADAAHHVRRRAERLNLD